MAVLQYILQKFPTPGNDLWSRAWTKIQISLPPGQQDNSKALPGPKQFLCPASPPPRPPAWHWQVHQAYWVRKLGARFWTSKCITTVYHVVYLSESGSSMQFSSSLCGSHANGKLCDSGGWPELRSQTIIITRARLTHWTRMNRVNIFF